MVQADFRKYLKQTDSYNCAIHVCLIAEAHMLRSGAEMRTLLPSTIQLSLERRRYHYFLTHLCTRNTPIVYLPPGCSEMNGAVVRHCDVSGFLMPCGSQQDFDRSAEPPQQNFGVTSGTPTASTWPTAVDADQPSIPADEAVRYL